jgi:hypothetical protein
MAKGRSADTPRISVNKLAEFMTVKPARQRQILRDQKYPGDFKGMFHKEAAEAVATCLASNLENTDVLDRAIRLLEQQTPEKIGTQRRISANIDSLQTFIDMLDEIDLKGATPSLGSHSSRGLTIRNVGINVRPEITLQGNGKSGLSLVGALKVHFPTTFALNADSAGYISALLQEWSKASQPDGQTYGPFCPVIDVGSRAIYPGVKSTAKRLKDIEAACSTIAALWPTITPSPDE